MMKTIIVVILTAIFALGLVEGEECTNSARRRDNQVIAGSCDPHTYCESWIRDMYGGIPGTLTSRFGDRKQVIQMTMDNSFGGNIGGRNYNKFYSVNTHCPALEAKVGEMVSEHLAGRFGRILDIGVGTGDTSYEVLVQCSQNLELVAIDIVAQMVEVASERFAAEPRVTVQQADALEYLKGLPDNGIDVAVSGFCFHNIPEAIRAAIVVEMRRVVKPGGLFITCDKVALDDEAAHLQTLTEQILMFDGFCDDPDYRRKWLEHYLVDDQARFRITESQWSQLLESNGFRSIRFMQRTLMDCLLSAIKS